MEEKNMKTCDCAEKGIDNCNCKEIAESELRRKLDLLLRTGSILMESAADTSRIMRTMKRAAAFLGLDERYMHLYINWNVLMVNYSDEEHSFSKFQRCEKHGINLTSISMVSKLTWTAIKENYSLEQYEQALNDIKATPRSFTPWRCFCLWWILYPVRLRLACILLLLPGSHSGLPPENVLANQRLQQLCGNRNFGIRGNADCVAHLVPFAQPIHRSRSSRLHAFRYPLASIDGLRPLHRAGSSADQLRERHARRIYRGGNGARTQHAADALCNGVRYRLRHPGMPHRQLCDGSHHDSSPRILGVCHCSSRISHGLLYHLQHP